MQILDRAAIRSFPEVRLVGKDLNVIISANEALEKAEDKGMDLVLVSGDTKPPVVRIQDFKKVQYEKKKARKVQKRTSLKEMQFKANISDHDFETKLNSIRKFLDRGDKVKVVVRLKGRERETPERAQELIDRIAETLDTKVTKVAGPGGIAILEPGKK